jgi:DNA polymerase III delta prime subunit
MRLIDIHKPTRLRHVIGNRDAIAQIERAVDDNNGYDGLVIMLTGKTGNGKTLIADLLAKAIGDSDPYRPDCTKEAEVSQFIDQIKRNIDTRPMFAPLSVYIFDEADKLHPNNIAKLKTAIDAIDRKRQQNLPCYVVIIFTSAKTKSQLSFHFTVSEKGDKAFRGGRRFDGEVFLPFSQFPHPQ